MEKCFNKVLATDLADDVRTESVVKALNSKTRRDILRLLGAGPLGIWEIAMRLNIPLSTISEHVSVLVKAGIVSVIRKTSDRGHGKIIARQYEKIEIGIVHEGGSRMADACTTIEVPIGSYTSFRVKQYCGMLGEDGYIGSRDDPDIFYSPQRFTAGLLWFDCGYLEYKIPVKHAENKCLHSLSLALELCSEAPGYNENWRSDIYFEVNGKRLCTYTSPGDFGMRRGVYTPAWWKDCTQYGILKKLEIKSDGSYLDGERAGDVTLDDLALASEKVITFRLGVDENAKNRGGINLFGKGFGDHDEHIVLTLSYRK